MARCAWASSFFLPDNRHSQIVITCHPIPLRASSFRLSLLLLLANLGFQYDFLLLGLCPSLHVCPCQKQPLTCMATLFLRTTISGVPGRLFTCVENRIPRLRNAFIRRNSGFVPFDLIVRITLDRFSGVNISIYSVVLAKTTIS